MNRQRRSQITRLHTRLWQMHDEISAMKQQLLDIAAAERAAFANTKHFEDDHSENATQLEIAAENDLPRALDEIAGIMHHIKNGRDY